MAWLATLHGNVRSAERHALDADATLRVTVDVPVDVTVVNVSTAGCLFLCLETVEMDGTISIGIAGIGQRQARIIRREQDRYGCEFTLPLLPDELTAVLATQEDTIVGFPPWLTSSSVAEDEPPHVPKLSGSDRLIIVVGLTIVIWTGLLASWPRLA